MTGLVIVAMGVIATTAYLVGRQRRLSVIEARLSALEDEAMVPMSQLGKLFAVFHYESLATELDDERQLADLDGRLASRNGSAAGGQRDA